MITHEQLTVGTRFTLVDDEDKNIWTVCNDPWQPEYGQFTTWAKKPAVFATSPNRDEPDALDEGIVLFTEIAEILD